MEVAGLLLRLARMEEVTGAYDIALSVYLHVGAAVELRVALGQTATPGADISYRGSQLATW